MLPTAGSSSHHHPEALEGEEQLLVIEHPQQFSNQNNEEIFVDGNNDSLELLIGINCSPSFAALVTFIHTNLVLQMHCYPIELLPNQFCGAEVQSTCDIPEVEASCAGDSESLQKLPWHINRKV
jgi:hypothetical protein